MLEVDLTHIEVTILEYFDVVASAPITILKVTNSDGTIFEHFDAFSVQIVVPIYFSKFSTSKPI
jgi:hypothetical protein